MWHIQKDVFCAYEQSKLKEALENLKIPHCYCADFEVVSVMGDFLEDDTIAKFRGSVDFIEPMRHKYIHAMKKMCPSWVTLKNYECSTYYTYWMQWLLNRDHFFVPWGVFETEADQYFKWLDSSKLFIRPNSGRKIFTGNYVDSKWWTQNLKTIQDLPGNSPKATDLILVSSHKGIVAEYRVMMHLDTVIDYSFYDGNDMAVVDRKDLTTFSENAAWSSNYFPDDYYTIDVSLMQDGDLKVIELNSLFSAGWYDADYEKIITHVENHS